ncbi:ead/Ea22-like family protein [Thiohalocapsa marina]|uniref:ead/Ea22-like family protein n=1 Tax=Thiohalocapsa marina TaxID=424902 RepID=UPI0036DAA672
MTDDTISRIEAALESEVTPGPWRTWIVGDVPERVAVTDADGLSILTVVHEADNASFAAFYVDADAEFIAACNPVTIRALLDRLKAAEAENERLREFERSAALTLPGVYYMDPPDGGSVEPVEQMRRMAKDAARYRWLRGDTCPDHSIRWTQWEVRRWSAPRWTDDLRGDALDAAIDAAMEAER